MRGSSAEVVAPWAGVAVAAWIDNERAAVSPEDERKRVGMRMRRQMRRTQETAVKHGLVGAVPKDEVAAVSKFGQLRG